MNRTFVHKLLIASLICSVILLIEGVLSFKTSTRFMSTTRWAHHTHEVIHEYERALLASMDAAAGERGYVLTGDAKFLEPLYLANENARSHFSNLKKLTADQPDRQGTIDTIIRLFSEQLGFYARCAQMRREGSVEEAIKMIQTGRGVTIENRLRSLIRAAQRKEEVLLSVRMQESDADASGFRLISLVSIVTIFAFIIGIYLATASRARIFTKHEALFTKEIADYKFALDEASIVAVTDQKGIIRHVNDNFCKISKYSAAELIGKDHRIINSGYHPKEFIRRLWVTIANGRIWRGELRNKAKDGSIYWVDTTIIPFMDEKGKPYQYMAIRSDITQRKEAEEKLLKMNEHLEDLVTERTLELTAALVREKELNEMKSRFVSMASHEFRTPLSAILSSINLIELYKGEEQGEKRAKHIARIKSSVQNLVDILNGFLSLDKLEQGKAEIADERFNLQEFCGEVMEEMNSMLKPGQKFTFDYSGENEVVLDKRILKNILLNFLSNAIKYSGENKEIHLIVEVGKDSIVVRVRDEGIGIPEEDQKNLFSKFYRAKNVTNIQGTGLGLNIVKRYVELLGGTISFESELNNGTTFTVRIGKRKKAPGLVIN